MNSFKKLYNWVLGWANSPYGAIALFILAFIESIFFPIPPDVLLIALALGSTNKAFGYALNCTIASVAGAVIGYAIGYYAWLNSAGHFTPFAQFFFNNIPGFTQDLYKSIQVLYQEWDFGWFSQQALLLFPIKFLPSRLVYSMFLLLCLF